MGRTILRSRTLVLCVALATIATGVVAQPAAGQAPPGEPWVVTLGDSAISGEAGRWAGNTNQAPWRVDAGGAGAYDEGTPSEPLAGCHRSTAAEAHIGSDMAGNPVRSLNLACSGARTSSRVTDDGTWKPGIDFYADGARKGQALMLQEFAAGNDVEAVTVLIGANDFGFADILTHCVLNWLTSPNWWKNYCHDDSSIRDRFTPAAVDARTNEVAGALQNVRQAMANAGYADSDYTVIVQTYSSPIPRGAQFRYPEAGWTRQSIGGCGVWNRDADWANDTAVVKMNQAAVQGAARSGLTNYVVLDMTAALHGRRLCESTVGLLEERGIASWQSPGAVDRTEWVSQVRTVTTLVGPYQLQEGMHPSYWGQLALRSCLRQAYGTGEVRGGTCVRGADGISSRGEPNMVLQ
ncbi:MAG: hypothetical protein JJE52_04280 [Acidimicrobiia bacterium]|nr:hypothetical protein [Acidimicrobiia bacterium]